MTFQDHIEKGYGCQGLKNAKYIYSLYSILDMTEVYDKTKSVEE